MNQVEVHIKEVANKPLFLIYYVIFILCIFFFHMITKFILFKCSELETALLENLDAV